MMTLYDAHVSRRTRFPDELLKRNKRCLRSASFPKPWTYKKGDRRGIDVSTSCDNSKDMDQSAHSKQDHRRDLDIADSPLVQLE